MKNELKQKSIYIRVSEEQKKEIEEFARRASRSVCNFILYAVQKYIDSKKSV